MMKGPVERHFSEEELLLHLLREEAVEVSEAIGEHLEMCDECRAVYRDYERVLAGISSWGVEDISEAARESDRERLVSIFCSDRAWLRRRSLLRSLADGVQSVWDYAVANPLPTLGYIVVAIAFASERTITVLGLDRLVPATTEVWQILKQFF